MKELNLRRFVLLLVVVSSLFAPKVYCQLYEYQINYGTERYFSSKEYFDKELLKLSIQMLSKALNYDILPVEEKLILLSAELEFYDGRAEFAIKLLLEFIQNNPTSLYNGFFYEKIAQFYFEIKDYELSVKYFKKAIEIGNNEYKIRKDLEYRDLAASSLLWSGIGLLLAGKVDLAREPFEECFRSYSDTKSADDALFYLGLISEMKGEEETAITYFKTLQRNYPRSNFIISSKVHEASNYISLRQDVQALIALDFAENLLSRIKDKDTIGLLYEQQSDLENIEEKIYFLRAEALSIGGKYDQAIDTYERVLRQYPNSQYSTEARLGIGLAYVEKGDFLRSIEVLDSLIIATKEESSKQRNLAELYRAMAKRRLGRISEAQALLSELQAKSNYPFQSIALLELGMIYYEKKEFTNAVKTLERALRESDDNLISAKINLMLGATHLELKHWSKAIQAYKNAEELAKRATYVQLPNKDLIIAEARLKQGITQVQDHRNSEAIQNFLYVIGNYPNDAKAEDALFWLAEAYYRSDMLRNSIDRYETLVAKFPNTKYLEDALYGLGWANFRLKNFKKSGEIFAQLVRAFPNSKYGVEVWLRQGDGYFVLKDFNKAIDSYRKVLEISGKGEEAQYAHYQICHSYYKMGNLDAAYNEVLEFVKRYPNSQYSPNALYLNGWIRFQQKNYVEAINSFNFLIDAYPNSLLVPRAKYAIGDALYNMNKFEEAAQQYRSIIDDYPTSPLVGDALRSLQYCYIALGRESEAMKIAEEYVNLNPGSPFAMDFALKKGEMFYTGKKFRSAIEEYQNFIQKYPDSERKPEALFWMGKSYQNLGDNENAIIIFKEITQKYPESEYAPESYLELGLIYKSLANIQVADSLFGLMQEKYPDNPSSAQAGFEQASIKFALGDTATALNIWRRIAEMFEGSEFGGQCLYRIAMYNRLSGNYEEAIREFNKIANMNLDPNLSAESQYRIGEIYYRLGDFSKAIEEFNKVREKFSDIEDWHTLALLNLGDSYEKLGMVEEAINCYRAVIATRPLDDYSQTAKRRLNLLEQKIKK
ncbi:MAG: tetratricopeptide repeat protein [Candidatus Kapaibacteriota bacterium]